MEKKKHPNSVRLNLHHFDPNTNYGTIDVTNRQDLSGRTVSGGRITDIERVSTIAKSYSMVDVRLDTGFILRIRAPEVTGEENLPKILRRYLRIHDLEIISSDRNAEAIFSNAFKEIEKALNDCERWLIEYKPSIKEALEK